MEKIEILYQDNKCQIEKIISYNHISPQDFFYCDNRKELVYIMEGEGEIEYYDGRRTYLKKGEELLIDSKCSHRVSYTSSPCVWLACYYNDNLDLYYDTLYNLFKLADSEYLIFHKKIVKDIPNIIGIRAPRLHSYAKSVPYPYIQNVIDSLKHIYYEENMLHALLIARIKDIEQLITELNNFLPYIDNWAVCDSLASSLKIIKKHKNRMLDEIKIWLKSHNTYTVRLSIVLLMNYYMDEHYDKVIDCYLDINSDEYYINMALAWGYSVALVKYYDKTLPYFINKKIINKWTHNKAIQKARESLRVDNDKKEFLNLLKY